MSYSIPDPLLGMDNVSTDRVGLCFYSHKFCFTVLGEGQKLETPCTQGFFMISPTVLPEEQEAVRCLLPCSPALPAGVMRFCHLLSITHTQEWSASGLALQPEIV